MTCKFVIVHRQQIAQKYDPLSFSLKRFNKISFNFPRCLKICLLLVFFQNKPTSKLKNHIKGQSVVKPPKTIE